MAYPVLLVAGVPAALPGADRNGVFFCVEGLGPLLLGGFMADGPEFVLPKLPISGSEMPPPVTA